MHQLILLITLGLAGCVAQAEPSDLGDGGSEVGEEVGAGTDICCLVANDVTTDPSWQDCEFGCIGDAGSGIPWLCNTGTHPTTCSDPACGVGSPCQAFNGTGTVIVCSASHDIVRH